MSAEYQPNLSFVSQIPAEFLKLREYSANPDISWIFLSASRNLKKKSAEGSALSSKALGITNNVPLFALCPDKKKTAQSPFVPRRVQRTVKRCFTTDQRWIRAWCRKFAHGRKTVTEIFDVVA